MLILVTGGSGSGKSAFAEQKAVSLAAGGELVYLATMQVYGEEGKKKVERHRQLRRGKGFETIERPVRVDRAEPGEDATVLLECMSNLMANEMVFPGILRKKRKAAGKRPGAVYCTRSKHCTPNAAIW